MDKPMIQDALHVPAKSLQATILGPDIGAVGWHQTLHSSLQIAQQPPVLPPTSHQLYQWLVNFVVPDPDHVKKSLSQETYQPHPNILSPINFSLGQWQWHYMGNT